MSEEEAHSVVEAKKVVEVIPSKNKGMAAVEESLGIIEEAPIVEVISEVEEIQPQVSLEEASLNDEENAIITELVLLIQEKNVPRKSVQKWCEQFSVNVVEDIPVEGIKKIINHLKNKESQ